MLSDSWKRSVAFRISRK